MNGGQEEVKNEVYLVACQAEGTLSAENKSNISFIWLLCSTELHVQDGAQGSVACCSLLPHGAYQALLSAGFSRQEYWSTTVPPGKPH